MSKLQTILNDPVYQQVVRESFGGVMYNVANRSKYDAEEIIKTWDSMTPAEKESAGGVTKGALNFLKEV